MLKSIQQKLVLIFILIILAIMLVLGTFLYDNVTNFYHREFKEQMSTIFNDTLLSQLNDAALSNKPEASMKEILDAFAGSIGIDTYRNFYILDGKTGRFLTGVELPNGSPLEMSAAISDAMVGNISGQYSVSSPIMEYAIPLPQVNPPTYIVYVVDTKNEMTDIIGNMLTILLQSLLLGVVIAMIIGILLSRTITTPIIGLTRRAEKLAKGEFETVSQVPETDELGILSNTFKYMSETLSNTLKEIAFEKNKLETVMKYMSDGIIAFDSDGRVLVINPAAKKLLDIQEEYDLEFDPYFKTYFDDIYLGDFIYLYNQKTEERIITVNQVALKLFFSCFRFENEKQAGVMVVIQDITKQQSIENSRREFVANVSHELKTPITTVKSYVETMLENELPRETQQSFLSVVNKEADRMTRLIQDLLTLSRLDSKIILQNREYFDVSALISELVTHMEMEAKKYRHTITYHELNKLPLLYMDRDRLEQILSNIISNAIKYTPEGGRIEVYAKSMYGNIYIKVKDNGIGIPEKDLERIFERFYRVDKARSRAQGGTGLGLAISKEMIRAFGGDIQIESKPQEGTQACIVLPADGKQIEDCKECSVDLNWTE